MRFLCITMLEGREFTNQIATDQMGVLTALCYNVQVNEASLSLCKVQRAVTWINQLIHKKS